MLVLTRLPNQSIIIEGGIEIMILEVEGQRVKIGVIAPDDTWITRDELVAEEALDRVEVVFPKDYNSSTRRKPKRRARPQINPDSSAADQEVQLPVYEFPLVTIPPQEPRTKKERWKPDHSLSDLKSLENLTNEKDEGI